MKIETILEITWIAIITLSIVWTGRGVVQLKQENADLREDLEDLRRESGYN